MSTASGNPDPKTELDEQDRSVPPYDGRQTGDDVDAPGKDVEGQSRPDPDATEGGATASPADEQPAAESGGDDPGPAAPGPAHEPGTSRGEDRA